MIEEKVNQNIENIDIAKLNCGLAILHYDGMYVTCISASDKFYSLFGFSKSEYINLAENKYGFKVCFPEGLIAKKTVFDKYVNNEKYFDMEINAYAKNGNLIWLKFNFTVVEKRNNEYLLNAVAVDVTNEKAPKYSEREKLLAVVSLSADNMFEYDIENDIFILSVIRNGEWSEIERYTDFETEWKNSKIVHEDDIELFEKFCDNLKLGNDNCVSEIRLQKEDNTYCWNRLNFKTFYNVDDKPERVVGKMTNISAHKETEKRLIEKAERDPLTKIYNKSTTRSLIRNFLQIDPTDSYDALIIVDVDNFKAVNDNLGHLFGDSILVDLSQELQDLFRSSDVVGRIGGDEFLIFLRGMKQKKHIEEKAADICRIFELLYADNNQGHITGSLGISLFPQDGVTYDELFRKADIALYSSKNEGKNCFTFYSDEEADNSLLDGSLHVNRYKKDTALTAGSNNFDYEIIDFAFDIINKSKDIPSAINLLMAKVGKHFNVSRISVCETVEKPFTMQVTYQWCAKNATPTLYKYVEMEQQNWKSYLSAFDSNDIQFFTNNNNLPDYYSSKLKQQIEDFKIKSMIEYCNFDNGELKAVVNFQDAYVSRVWTIYEARALKTIGKIITTYMFQMRQFEKVNSIVDKLTNFDKLTGLPRFNKFKDKALQYIAESFSDEKFAIVYCDINNFKFINEKYGSDCGDVVLKNFAEKLPDVNSVTPCKCRMYSDKFMSLIRFKNCEDIDTIIRCFINEFVAMEKENFSDSVITVAVGVYIIDNNDSFDMGTAVDNANIARKIAKKSLENSIVIYQDNMKYQINKAMEIVNDAKIAITNHEFIVYYQPKISLHTNKIVGAEALVRWKKDGRIIPPNDFIPYLEKNGMIVNIDFYVYEEVCQFIRRHLDYNRTLVPISLNVSRVHLRNPQFLTNIRALIERNNIPPELIEFELTESVFLENKNAAVSAMTEMKELGFTVSIDDFGSGFSSLNLLKNLPVDILKIDKEFFSNDTFQNNDKIIISSIINMAGKMKISVICEGVETSEQVDFLKENNCDMVQGFYFEKPLPENEFDNFLINNI